MGLELSFLLFFILVTCGIGYGATRKSRGSEVDYFLATQSVSPYVLALSSTASKFSGYVFVGFMGVAYTQGTAVLWLTLGLMGYYVIFYFITTRVQEFNHGGWALSIAELMTFWHGENRVRLRRVIGFLTVFFLSVYAAAQMKAGGKALEVALGYPAYVGVLISLGVVVFYCWSGGIRASMWTDVVQVLLMLVSLSMVLVYTLIKFGGLEGTWAAFVQNAPNADYASLFPQNLSFGGPWGLVVYFLGSLSIGCCAMGQPHMLVRTMALKEKSDVKKFIAANYAFEFVFSLVFVLAGLCTRMVLGEITNFDAEHSLFLTAKALLPAVAVGVVLAGAFSATLSTADSQILSCSASLMRDFPEPPSTSLRGAKIGTVSFAILSALLAAWGGGNIFELVTFAYSGLGVSIGSLLLLRLFNAPLTENGGIFLALLGFFVVIAWTKMGLSQYAFASLPGFLAVGTAYGAGRALKAL